MARKSGSFQEQLGKIKTEKSKNNRQQKDYMFEGYRFFPELRHPTKWEEDGFDHINISAMGNTELGPALYVGTRLKFVHADLGEFHSLSNFWAYLETNAATERLRFLSTTARMEELERHERHQVEFISFLILDAAWQRIQQLPPLLEAIKTSDLPFDNYFVGGSALARWRRSISHWVIEGYELMRQALKEGTEPDFSAFMRGKTREEIIDITVETHGLRRARVQRVSNGFATNRLMAELNALTKGTATPRRRQEIHNLRAPVTKEVPRHVRPSDAVESTAEAAMPVLDLNGVFDEVADPSEPMPCTLGTAYSQGIAPIEPVSFEAPARDPYVDRNLDTYRASEADSDEAPVEEVTTEVIAERVAEAKAPTAMQVAFANLTAKA